MKTTSKNIHTRARLSAARGFTLMEMILVLAIISVLVGLGVFAMKGVLEGAEDGKASADIKTMETNLIRFKTMTGRYPSQAEGFEAFVKRPTGSPPVRMWRPLMEEKGLYDPWNEKYQYRYPGKHNSTGYDIFSMGTDKKEGTEDDIGNW
jgi:general secretion pathway protein G